MIFVTVGAQMPFDRLVKVVDDWAHRTGRDDVLAQIGPTEWTPDHIDYTQFMEPTEFRKHVESADVLVAHAGMGSIITAMEAGKPILVMPRRGDLRETRNDHQIATANRFKERPGVAVALDEGELSQRLDSIDALIPPDKIRTTASAELIDAVREFIENA